MTQDKILIFGNGQIGNMYLEYFAKHNLPAEMAQADITKPGEVQAAIAKFQPTVVINTAAKTNLEYVSQHKEESMNINVLGADNVAQECAKNDIYFVHFSSGCIFQSKDASDAKSEDAQPEPQAFYSWTKIWAENLIPWQKPANFKYIILRPRQPISSQVSHRNTIVKMLTFTRYIDIANSVTVLEDMMDWTMTVLEKRPVGTLNFANPGAATAYQIAQLLKEIINPEMAPILISKDDLNKLTPNKRVDTVLDVSKMKTLGINPTPIDKRLREVIAELKHNIDTMDPEKLKTELTTTATESAQRTIVNNVWQNLLK